jgi:hypothetical protein
LSWEELGKTQVKIDPSQNAVQLTGSTVAETEPLNVFNKTKKVPNPPRLTLTLSNSGYKDPLWLGKDKRTIYGRSDKALLKSVDDWATTTTIYTFPIGISQVRELDNGELIVACANNGTDTPGSLWLSSESQTVWNKVLDAQNVFVSFGQAWGGISAYGNIVVAGEYGISKTPPNCASKVYLSKDYGANFNEILDIGQVDGQHIHGVAFDPWFNRIWVCNGDGDNNKVRYSDDFGVTWNFAIAPSQVVAILPMRSCVLFLSDGSMNGVYRYVRKSKFEAPVLEVAYVIDDSTQTRYCGHQVYQHDFVNGHCYLPFVPVGAGIPVIVLGTYDGMEIYEVYRSEYVSSGSFRGIQRLMGPTTTGILIGSSSEKAVSGSYQLVTGNAPTWVEI